MKSLAKLTKSEFGKRLKAARIEAGLSPTAFAEAMNVRLASAYRWEAGAWPGRDPDTGEERIEKICRILEKDLSYFLGPAPMPPTTKELLATIGRLEDENQQLRASHRRTIREASGWQAAESPHPPEPRVPRRILDLLEQISPDNKDAWEMIEAAALTVGKAKPRVTPKG